MSSLCSMHVENGIYKLMQVFSMELYIWDLHHEAWHWPCLPFVVCQTSFSWILPTQIASIKPMNCIRSLALDACVFGTTGVSSLVTSTYFKTTLEQAATVITRNWSFHWLRWAKAIAGRKHMRWSCRIGLEKYSSRCKAKKLKTDRHAVKWDQAASCFIKNMK